MTDTVRVKSKLLPTNATVRLLVITEWLNVIGPDVFALYMLYVALEELHLSMGIRKLSVYLGYSPQRIKRYNALLEVCGLISIERGNATTANTIHLLEPDSITHQTISGLYNKARNHDLLGSQHTKLFMDGFYQRLEAYKSVYERLEPDMIQRFNSRATTPTEPVVLSTNGNGNGNGQQPTNNPSRASALIATAAGIEGTNVSRCAERPAEVVLAWTLDAWAQAKLENPPGYIYSRVISDRPAPAYWLEASHELLRMSQEDWDTLQEAAQYAKTFGRWQIEDSFYPRLTPYILDQLLTVLNKWSQELSAALGLQMVEEAALDDLPIVR